MEGNLRQEGMGRQLMRPGVFCGVCGAVGSVVGRKGGSVVVVVLVVVVVCGVVL